MAILALNRRAKFDYQVLETYEAGLVLSGFEVKAIKTGRLGLKGAYVVIKNNEAFLINALVSPYQAKNTPAHYEPNRNRKLLLHKKEISSLIGQTKQKGLTLIPLRLYTKGRKQLIKLEFALAKGKKKFDKRETIKKREVERKIKRAMLFK